MNSIIMICDDSHIATIKESLQPLLVEKIGILSDFDTGLKEVFEKRPHVVFIQDEIAGIRGETVTRHIRSLLQSKSPEFIQLNHLPAVSGTLTGLGNDINLNLPQEELLALFRERLEQFPGISWRKEVAEGGDIQPVERPLPLFHEEPGATPPPAAPAFSLPTSPPSSGTAAVPPPGDMDAAVSVTLFPAGSGPPLSRYRWALLSGGAMVLLCGAVSYYLLPVPPALRLKSASSQQMIPVSGPLPPAHPRMALPPRLPSCIPKEGFDPAYGAARPGWERYVSSGQEYLVFREKGALRALQAIALGEDPLPPPMVSSLLRELSGESNCVILSRSSRDGYLIEQGRGSQGIEVIFYKKKGTGATRGVVVSIPRPGDDGPRT